MSSPVAAHSRNLASRTIAISISHSTRNRTQYRPATLRMRITSGGDIAAGRRRQLSHGQPPGDATGAPRGKPTIQKPMKISATFQRPRRPADRLFLSAILILTCAYATLIYEHHHHHHHHHQHRHTAIVAAQALASEPLDSSAATGSARVAPAPSGEPEGPLEGDEEALWLEAAELARPYDYHANMPVITKRELAAAIKEADARVDSLTSALGWSASPEVGEDELDNAVGDSAHWLASSMFLKAAPDERDEQLANQTRQALVSEETTRSLARAHKLTRAQVMRGLPLISLEQSSLGRRCSRPARTFTCVPGRYRSLSGHCNNVQSADWGAAQTPLVRYAPARYADHVARPVRAARSPPGVASPAAALPSARAVSLAVHEAAAATASTSASGSGAGQAHSHMTTMMSFFGQFLFHDLALVPQLSRSVRGCCQVAEPARRHPECMPIEMDASVGGVGGVGVNNNKNDSTASYCLDYVRSTPATRPGCNLGPRDQVNLVSSFLDGSVIYGSSEAQMRQLRAFVGGRLRSQRVRPAGGAANNSSAVHPSTTTGAGVGAGATLELLPAVELNNQTDAHWLAAARDCLAMAAMRANGRAGAAPAQAQAHCFQAGDLRVNENIGLTLMHTIWMREHNWLADKLAALNRHWRDERLFQEARRIVVAELQHIAYAEFLPSVLGDEVMARLNLTLAGQGYGHTYEPALNPSVANELATAVFPFILSTIPAALERYSDRLEMLGRTPLAATFMDASELFKRHKFAQYLTGMMSQSAMEPGLGLVPMAAHMEAEMGVRAAPSGPAGTGTGTGSAPQVDAVALAVQRGRDHGLRPYLYWRRVCQLKPVVRNWPDLEQVMPATTVRALRRVYATPDQLDLYLALLESPAPGASLGPTFVCLLSRQFYQLKHGDRYWFENDLPGLAFTPGQLDEIRQTSLAKVMCRNSQASISFIQPAPMLASDPYLNAYQYCTNRAMNDGLDLRRWRQAVQSAQEVADEQLMDELMARSAHAHLEFGNSRALERGKRLISENGALMGRELERARHQLARVARSERAARARRQAHQEPHPHAHRGYRYLPRLKREALRLGNESVVYELATNEVVRSLVRLGKDRERGQSVEADIRDFLYSLESLQMEQLLENAAASEALGDFIGAANGLFLSDEQRRRLATDQSSAGAAAAAGSAERLECQEAERVFPCDHTTPYRTITGWCNNLANPKFGASFTAHDRLLPNAYADGLSKPRQFSVVSAGGGGGGGAGEEGQRVRLPSARLISTRIHDDRSQLHSRYSLALMQFGQFGVDHDLTRTPFSVALDGSLLDCSACDSPLTLHRDCWPIEIPADDAHFGSAAGSGGGKRCLHFVRSLNGQPALGPRQQLNALTAYLDGSEVYGSDFCEASSLRAFSGGRLNASAYPAAVALAAGLAYQPREILPTTRANPECATPSGLCFHAGDQRASEQPGLTAMHTIFVRLHNWLVAELAQLNRHWTDERLYQTGRRIVGALLQRVTYAEFAPRLLGLDFLAKYDLGLRAAGYAPPSHYDDHCSATILTEFASAAFRMGHSLIRPAFPLLQANYRPAAANKSAGAAFQLRAGFFNSHRILAEPQLIDSILRGLVATPIETLDNSVTSELTNHLFERPRQPHSAMDLVSLNIQRARDHGVASYNRYRVKCNLTRARTFDELAGEVPAKLIKRLAGVYAHVDDIDLFTGGMSELPVHGGIVGPTFGCIIGLQLSRLKRCDRFWHETSDPFVRFSAAQLAELRKMSLAKIICSQSDTIDSIQRHAMDLPDNYLNPRVPCASLPQMDLSVWRENQKSCQIAGTKLRIELGSSRRVNPCKSCTCTLEGPVCRTAKIDCVKLMKRARGSDLSRVMADKSCLVQCAWALDMQPPQSGQSSPAAAPASTG